MITRLNNSHKSAVHNMFDTEALRMDNVKWTGQMRVEQNAGCSRATQLVYRNPLRIFERQELGTCVFTVSNYGGGILQGDRIGLSIHCGAYSSTILSSQASTHVYRNEKRQHTSFTMFVNQEEGSSYQVIPEPVVLHKDALFSQKNTFNLKKEASLLFADHVQPGRYGNGERFMFQSYFSETKINVEEKPVVLDRFCMYPSVHSDAISSTAGYNTTHDKQPIVTPGISCDGAASWNGCNQLLTLYCIGPKYAGLVHRLKRMKNPEQKRVQTLSCGSSQSLSKYKKRQSWITVIPVHRMKPGKGYIVRVLCSERDHVDKILMIVRRHLK